MGKYVRRLNRLQVRARLLIDHEATVHTADGNGYTLLHAALQCASTNISSSSHTDTLQYFIFQYFHYSI